MSSWRPPRRAGGVPQLAEILAIMKRIHPEVQCTILHANGAHTGLWVPSARIQWLLFSPDEQTLAAGLRGLEHDSVQVWPERWRVRREVARSMWAWPRARQAAGADCDRSANRKRPSPLTLSNWLKASDFPVRSAPKSTSATAQLSLRDVFFGRSADAPGPNASGVISTERRKHCVALNGWRRLHFWDSARPR
jgi:hypothetical protein